MSIPLAKLRKQIDAIDAHIISLLHERMSVVAHVGAFKKMNGKEILDMERWQEVLGSRIKLGIEAGLSQELIQRIWEAIHDEALRIEKKK